MQNEPIKFPGEESPNPDENPVCQPPVLDNSPCTEMLFGSPYLWVYENAQTPRAIRVDQIVGIKTSGPSKCVVTAMGERIKVIHSISNIVGVLRSTNSMMLRSMREDDTNESEITG